MAAEKPAGWLERVENVVGYLVLLLLALLPTVGVVMRLVFRTGIPASSAYFSHLVLWAAFVGGMITSREGRHLSMSVGVDMMKREVADAVRVANAFISASVATALAWSSLAMVLVGFDPSAKVGVLPIMAVAAIMPVGFGFMAFRFVERAWALPWGRLALLGVVVGTFLGIGPIDNILTTLVANPPAILDPLDDVFNAVTGAAALPAIVVLVASAFTGAPIFIVLGGVAYMLFAKAGGALAVIPNEAYTMLTGDTIPAIPLFTLAGFLLSESQAAGRLVRLFKAFFGWFPGGLAIMSVLVCAFFTTFTGASGVTILALGALLVAVLAERGTSSRFAMGLLTSSGSIGLLFPPSLPIILYGVIAEINIKDMFIAGIVPGIVLVLTLSGVGVANALRNKVKMVGFRAKEAAVSLRESVWEVLLPVVIIVCYFGGITTLVETSALAVVYVLIVSLAIKRDLRVSELPGVLLKCLPIIGGVLVILAVAKGFSYYIVDAQVPTILTHWVEHHIHSRYVFLILLNLTLLVTGGLMDIFSAILVVAPLVIPVGVLFGVNPVHLGIIFLANLELGYLTPPIGLNLFLASYRFNKPLATIWRYVIPFSLTLFLAVLVITYVPWFSTGLVGLLHGGR